MHSCTNRSSFFSYDYHHFCAARTRLFNFLRIPLLRELFWSFRDGRLPYARFLCGPRPVARMDTVHISILIYPSLWYLTLGLGLGLG